MALPPFQSGTTGGSYVRTDTVQLFVKPATPVKPGTPEALIAWRHIFRCVPFIKFEDFSPWIRFACLERGAEYDAWTDEVDASPTKSNFKRKTVDGESWVFAHAKMLQAALDRAEWASADYGCVYQFRTERPYEEGETVEDDVDAESIVQYTGSSTRPFHLRMNEYCGMGRADFRKLERWITRSDEHTVINVRVIFVPVVYAKFLESMMLQTFETANVHGV